MINSELTHKILWTNPNTSNTADFANQTITLSDSWDKIFVVCRNKYGDNNELTIPVFKGINRQFQLCASEFAYDSSKGSGIKILTRYCSYSSSDDKLLTIGQCYGQEIYGSGSKTLTNLSSHLVPLKIYKI